MAEDALLVGKSAPPQEGAYVYVVANGLKGHIVDVRPGGVRVKVEFDDKDKPSRFYNVGMNSKYELAFADQSELDKAKEDEEADKKAALEAEEAAKAAAKTADVQAQQLEYDKATQRDLCKFGCGRQVQPGLTRNLNKFDTCCKACSTCRGKGEHSANCGREVDRYDAAPGVESFASEDSGACGVVDAASGADPSTGGTGGYFPWPFGRNRASTSAAVDKDQGIPNKENKEKPQPLPCRPSIFVRENARRLEGVYELGKLLGEGSFGQVFEAVHKVSGEKRVCKKIMKAKAKAGEDGAMTMEEILAEIQAMAVIDHPNVLRVYEYFQDDDSVSQIMEPCRGGELQDKIFPEDKKDDDPRGYDEKFMRDIMKQALRALAFMHHERFIHKDLKPQNIMLVAEDSSFVKVIDFGLSELFEGDDKEQAFGGTLLYMAPEVFSNHFDMKADIWSMGVILYNMICGDYPFMGQWPLPCDKTMLWWQNETQRKIQEEHYADHPRLKNHSVSERCIEFMELMLTKDRSKRPSAAECLRHPWFTEEIVASPVLSVGLLQALHAYSILPPIRQAMTLLVASECSPPKMLAEELRKIFTYFDFGNHGSIHLGDLRGVLEKSNMKKRYVSDVCDALDQDGSQVVEWTEFLAGVLCLWMAKPEQTKLLDAAFSRLDSDQDGKVSCKDVLDLFAVGEAVDEWKRRLPDQLQRRVGSDPFDKKAFMDMMTHNVAVLEGNDVIAVRSSAVSVSVA